MDHRQREDDHSMHGHAAGQDQTHRFAAGGALAWRRLVGLTGCA